MQRAPCNGRRVRLIEKNTSGTLLSDRRYVWAGEELIQERNGTTPSTITRRYYPTGVNDNGTEDIPANAAPPEGVLRLTNLAVFKLAVGRTADAAARTALVSQALAYWTEAARLLPGLEPELRCHLLQQVRADLAEHHPTLAPDADGVLREIYPLLSGS